MREKLSVTIITKNEEKNIKECLESIKWADEIIIVDAFSTDSTIEIAKNYTDKIIQREWNGFANQKAFALQNSSNEWVLSLDADERVSESLKEKILHILSNPEVINQFSGYQIKRDNFFLNKRIKSCGWGDDYQVRLFKKSKTKISNRLVHEGFIVDGNLGKLNEPILHFSYRSFKEALDKINHYSSLEALEKASKQKSNIFTILFYPVIYFIQHFIFRYGFVDGIYGFFVSLFHAWTKLLVQLKIWELQHKTYDDR